MARSTRDSSLSESLPGTIERVLWLVRNEAKHRALDLPAGRGHLAKALADEGMEVVAADIEAGKFLFDGIAVEQASLNAALPWDDEWFDLVLCIEGIEHLEAPFNACREFYRILKPGGCLVISTPNVASLWSRIKFLFTGTFFWFDPEEIPRSGHVNAVPWFHLEHMIRSNGFDVEAMTTNHIRPFWVPFGAFVRAIGAVVGAWKRVQTDGNRRDLIAGELVIIKARKPPQQAAEPASSTPEPQR